VPTIRTLRHPSTIWLCSTTANVATLMLSRRPRLPLRFSATVGLRIFASRSDILLDRRNLQTENKQHRLFTHLPRFWCSCIAAMRLPRLCYAWR
jgi:hypothetical protein